MGLKVGDVIVGREGGGDPETGWWQEQRLTLKYIGEQCCVWKSEWSNKALTKFRDDGESANWTLSCRDWYLVRPNSDSPSFEHTDMTPKINNAIEALVDALREESPERMTTFRLFVNCEERVIETSERTPAELKAAGISMRNLRGNFIR